MEHYKSILERAAFSFAGAYGHLWASAVLAMTDPESEHYDSAFVLDFNDPDSVSRVDDLSDKLAGPVGGQYLAPELGGGVYHHTTQTGRTTLDLWMNEGKLYFLLEISRPTGAVVVDIKNIDGGVARAEFSSPLPRHLEAAKWALAPLAEFLQVDGVLEALRLEEMPAIERQRVAASTSEKELGHLVDALKSGNHPANLAATLEEYRLLEQKLTRFLGEQRFEALEAVYRYTNPG